MTRPRSTLVSVADTPYYHCIGRCVRRAYLCGDDAVTGRSFSHRRQWILDRLTLLTDTFAIDLCAYALMSNHYHLVVRINSERAKQWSAREIIERWTRIYAGPAYAQAFLRGEPLTATEQALLDERVQIWSSRLTDLSWFMRCLNEWLARMANQEDNCTGRFWEGRFKSQALLDETALLTAMAYVDLNPIRAGMTTSLIDADFTSVQQRLFEIAKDRRTVPAGSRQVPMLLSFTAAPTSSDSDGLPFNLQDYLDLVDTAGRCVRSDKRGAIPLTTPTLLTTLGINPDEWLKTVTELQARFELFIGSPQRLRQLAEQRGWRWVRGMRASRRLYARANE
jgi:REP element-mobilizing transposase RayT